MTRKHIQPRLTAYLVDHMGEVVHVQTLMAELDLTRTQIQQAISLLRRKGVAIAVEMSGNAWRYTGPKIDTGIEVLETTATNVVIDTRGNLYEEVGRTREGDVLLEDAEGVLYVAKEVRW